MVSAGDIATFLASEPMIAKINFKFDGFMVYPSAYSTDLSGLLAARRISVVVMALPAGVGARWENQGDTLKLRTGFDIRDLDDQTYLVHEMTHAHVDYHRGGNSYFSAWQSVELGEAIGYLAEAMFREAKGLAPLDTTPLRTEAQRIAKGLLAGGYEVGKPDVDALQKAVGATTHYAKKWGWLIADGIR
jgi:hypothetical protein